MTNQAQQSMTVVLVHAAWADGSSWSKVIPRLQRLGLQVVSAQIPLTSLMEDIVAVQRVLGRVNGPVVLAAHSYGGAVITGAAAGQPMVKALVFIAAMAPDEGETVGQLLHQAEQHAKAPQLVPDESGLLWMSADGFANAVAPDATSEEITFMTATQKPIALKCLVEPMTKPAWKEKPSWYLLAEKDRMISPVTQRFMAGRMSALIDSLAVDHTPLASAPESVVRLIMEAVESTLYEKIDLILNGRRQKASRTTAVLGASREPWSTIY
jgi:pimeloyl-ACP methyl ester carboxylesterase